MRQNLKEIIKLNNNPAVKLILREYEEEEKRHQKLIDQLRKTDFRPRRPEEILRHFYPIKTLFL